MLTTFYCLCSLCVDLKYIPQMPRRFNSSSQSLMFGYLITTHKLYHQVIDLVTFLTTFITHLQNASPTRKHSHNVHNLSVTCKPYHTRVTSCRRYHLLADLIAHLQTPLPTIRLHDTLANTTIDLQIVSGTCKPYHQLQAMSPICRTYHPLTQTLSPIC